jgi:cell cycle sensor histidine kinase DivJ
MTGGGALGPGHALLPLLAGVVPAATGAVLGAWGRGGRLASLLIWTLGVIAAGLLTGGATGPLAAWCLAPLAASAAFREPDLIPFGAAGAIAAAAIEVLSSLLLPLPAASPAADPWLGLLALGGAALGMGSALVALYVEVRASSGRQRSEEALSEVLDRQPQLLVTVPAGGRIGEVFGRLPMGWRASDLVDRRLADLAQRDDRPQVETALDAAVASGAATVAFRPTHDPCAWWELTLTATSSGSLVGALRDASTQKAREAELAEAREAAEQQNQAKSRFLANMSHELRTPLNAIMGFSDIMRQRLFGPLSDRYGDYAELVHESGAHLLELINDVLDMSKIEAARFELAREIFDAREAVSAALRLLRGQADRAGVALRGVLPADPLEADADRRALKQIAINLVSNALKFTPRGGGVTLTLQAAGEQLELVVADTGVGIGPEDLARLGRPFEQAGDSAQKAGGSGLGLSLVRAFAQLHGGEMVVESALGEGTTVIVRLPVLSSSKARSATAVAVEA